MKRKIYEFCLFLKILNFVSKGSLNIPEYRCLLIGRVQYLYTIEPALENIAFHRFQSGGRNVMCVCLYQKSVCKEYRTEGVFCRYKQCIRISVFVLSRRVYFLLLIVYLKMSLIYM